jgi:hypothetical protein
MSKTTIWLADRSPRPTHYESSGGALGISGDDLDHLASDVVRNGSSPVRRDGKCR